MEGLKEKKVVARGVATQLEQFDTLYGLAEAAEKLVWAEGLGFKPQFSRSFNKPPTKPNNMGARKPPKGKGVSMVEEEEVRDYYGYGFEG